MCCSPRRDAVELSGQSERLSTRPLPHRAVRPAVSLGIVPDGGGSREWGRGGDGRMTSVGKAGAIRIVAYWLVTSHTFGCTSTHTAVKGSVTISLPGMVWCSPIVGSLTSLRRQGKGESHLNNLCWEQVLDLRHECDHWVLWVCNPASPASTLTN